MQSTIIEKYLNLQEQLLANKEYAALLREYQEKNVLFLSVLERLDAIDRDIIEDYLGICAELHTKMLLFACER